MNSTDALREHTLSFHAQYKGIFGGRASIHRSYLQRGKKRETT